jgi:hypothetical protein
MLDGHVDHPVYLALLLAAGLVAGPATILCLLYPSGRGEPRPLAALGTAWLLAIAVLLVPLNAVHAARNQPLVWLFGSELQDVGPVEVLTAANFLLAAGFAAVLARAAAAPPLVRAGFAALGVAAFLVAGEEVSWGQHLFGWASPEVFAERNLQGETNLHNFIAATLLDPVYAAVGWLLIAAALLLRLQPRAALFAPVREIVLSLHATRFAAPLMLLAGVLLQHEAFEELAELAASALLLYALAALRRDLAPATVRRRAAAAGAGSAPLA